MDERSTLKGGTEDERDKHDNILVLALMFQREGGGGISLKSKLQGCYWCGQQWRRGVMPGGLLMHLAIWAFRCIRRIKLPVTINLSFSMLSLRHLLLTRQNHSWAG